MPHFNTWQSRFVYVNGFFVALVGHCCHKLPHPAIYTTFEVSNLIQYISESGTLLVLDVSTMHLLISSCFKMFS